MSLIQNTTPLAANASWTSSIIQTTRATTITGSVFADQSGVLAVEQGGDGVNFDIISKFNIVGGIGEPIEVPVVDQYFQVVYTNGTNAQSTFRLFIDLRDPYGAFLAPQTNPSAGGNYLVLYQNSNGLYQVVGRFQAGDGYAANQSAAVYQKLGGQYASFPVANATVSVETLVTTTEHAIASF